MRRSMCKLLLTPVLSSEVSILCTCLKLYLSITPGKNPVVLDPKSDFKLAAKRILWGRFLNAGQVSPVHPAFHILC